MNCTYTNEQNEQVPMVMGCYGIGITRTLASIIEQFHDEAGIIWPLNVAPYHAVVVPINYKDEEQQKLAHNIYEELKKNGVEVILDDRDAKPGFKFKDWELIGIPYMIICGRNSSNGIVEFKERKNVMNKEEIKASEVINIISNSVKEL